MNRIKKQNQKKHGDLESMLCWPSALGLGLQAPGTLQCRKQIPLTVTSITDSFLVRGGALCLLSLLSAGVEHVWVLCVLSQFP